MSTETQRPNGELSDSGLVASDFTDHDADPDSDSSTTAATGNDVNTEYGVDFPTPTGDPTVGADLQEFRAGVDLFDIGQSGVPDVRIELWENGSLVRADSNSTIVGFTVLSFKWNANELATSDGSLVQCKVIGTKSGGFPFELNTIDIGQIEWNVEYSALTHYTLSAAFGVYTITGIAASLDYDQKFFTLEATKGIYSIGGTVADLDYDSLTFTILHVRDQVNLDSVATGIVMPAGWPSLEPTGVRNLGTVTKNLTFTPAGGEFFWDASAGTTVSSLAVNVLSGESALFVYVEGKGWTPY